MANNPSAEKANRQSIKRRTRNRAAMSALRTAVKKARAAIDGKAAEANDLRKSAISIIDKAVSRGVLKRNTASRYVSRLGLSAAKRLFLLADGAHDPAAARPHEGARRRARDALKREAPAAVARWE